MHSHLYLINGVTRIRSNRAFPIFRMNKPTGLQKTSRRLQPLFKTQAEVMERTAVGIKTFTATSKDRNVLRREVQHLSKLCFLCTDFFFREFALFNFNT